MRLTLRTLLAYLDDILDPADKEELTKKVESSEFAEELIHRTRDTMRRLRLSAPQVVGTGMGLDPNTVAEYLDNVLPPDSVGDFERICLESDMHLAEVASCHHVLTMVLGEPAEVDPVARQRMYAIPAEAENQRRSRSTPAVAGAQAAGNGAAARVAPAADATNQSILMEVPDYLRASGWSAARMAFVAIAAVLLVVAAVFFLPATRDWFGEDTTADLAQRNDVPPAAPPIEPPAAAGAERISDSMRNMDAAQAVPAVPGPVPPSATGVESGAAPVGTQAAPTDAMTTSNQQMLVPPVTPPPSTPQPQGVAATPPVENSFMPNSTRDPGATVAPPTTPMTGESTSPAGGSPADSSMKVRPWPAAPGTESGATPEPGGGMPDAGNAAAATRPMPAPGTAANDKQIIPAGATPTNPTPVEAPQPLVVGTYLGDTTVLLRYNEPLRDWFRLEPRTQVLTGDRLLSLPEFRPRVSLPTGVQMDVSGGTLIEVATADVVDAEGLPPGLAGVPAVEVLYGRIVLINTVVDEQPVRLKLGTTTADVRLARNAPLGIQVTRQHSPGADPRKTPAPVTALVVAPAGGCVWMDKSGEQRVMEPAQWTVAEGSGTLPGPLTLPPPEWLDREPTVQRSEQLAAPLVEAALITTRPADDQLLELYTTTGRREVKSLTARSSIHVGMFVPFIEALRDSEQRPNWRSHIDALRSAMALGRESADQLWLTLVAQRGDRAAADLYEMLCGYNPEQVGKTPEERSAQGRPLARLIDWLESENLDYRVLAVENLADITGKRLLQNPAATGRPLEIGIGVWKRRLTAGEL